jgi:hypothetical protein
LVVRNYRNAHRGSWWQWYSRGLEAVPAPGIRTCNCDDSARHRGSSRAPAVGRRLDRCPDTPGNEAEETENPWPSSSPPTSDLEDPRHDLRRGLQRRSLPGARLPHQHLLIFQRTAADPSQPFFHPAFGMTHLLRQFLFTPFRMFQPHRPQFAAIHHPLLFHRQPPLLPMIPAYPQIWQWGAM